MYFDKDYSNKLRQISEMCQFKLCIFMNKNAYNYLRTETTIEIHPKWRISQLVCKLILKKLYNGRKRVIFINRKITLKNRVMC